MCKKLCFFLLLVILALPVPGPAQAQDRPPVRVVMLGGQNLWEIDQGGIRQLTSEGSIVDAVLSPDGTRIAYAQTSPLAIEAFDLYAGSPPLPRDIHVIDLDTHVITTLAGQPPDAALVNDPARDNAILHSTPAWSPDGTRLAWGELHYPSYAAESNRIMVYDFATGETRALLSDLPFNSGLPVPQEPGWGGGIAVMRQEPHPSGSNTLRTLLVYSDQDGSLLTSTVLPDDYLAHLWANVNGQARIVVRLFSGRLDVINPQTGELEPAPGDLQLYNPLVADSAAIRLMTYPGVMWPDLYRWALTYPNGQRLVPEKWLAVDTAIALAPDGQSVAVSNSDNTLDVYWPDSTVLHGGTLNVPATQLFWGPVAWRLVPLTECDGALPSMIRATETVKAVSPVNLVSEPAQGDVLAQIQPDTLLTVLSGPVCNGGMVWWEAIDQSTIGWIAESDSSTYFVIPTAQAG